jgi:hypothetical protein
MLTLRSVKIRLLNCICHGEKNKSNNGHRGNYYKFILLSKNSVDQDFKHITLRTSPVYDYSLGDDKEKIISKHICLPIWYNLDRSIIDKVIKSISEVK